MAGHRARGSERERGFSPAERMSLAETRRRALRDEIPSTGELGAQRIRLAMANGWKPEYGSDTIDDYLNDDGGNAA